MRFEAVYPISGEDLAALPVREIGPAVRFYREQLGFTAVQGDEATALVTRDGVELSHQFGRHAGQLAPASRQPFEEPPGEAAVHGAGARTESAGRNELLPGGDGRRTGRRDEGGGRGGGRPG